MGISSAIPNWTEFAKRELKEAANILAEILDREREEGTTIDSARCRNYYEGYVSTLRWILTEKPAEKEMLWWATELEQEYREALKDSVRPRYRAISIRGEWDAIEFVLDLIYYLPTPYP